ncbi:MAG TPA: OmpA family protein, partial [Polyangiaceae bacterium]
MGIGNRRIIRHFGETLVVTLEPRRPLTEEERSETERALFVLMADHEARDLEITPVMEEIHAELFGEGIRFASRFDRDSSNHFQASERIERDLKQAVRSGRLLIVPEARPIIRLARTEEPVAAPDLRPAPEAPPTFFEVRFVDEIGEAIAGLDVIIAAEGRPNNLKTDGDGKARLDGVRASFASVRVASVQGLRDIVEPRWEKLRPGELPVADPMVKLPLTDDLGSVSLASELLHLVVIVPPLGKLFVELFDRTGRVRHANRAYAIRGPESFEGTTDSQGRLLHQDVPPGDYTLELTLEFFQGTNDEVSETYESPLVVLDRKVSVPQQRMLGAVPHVVFARMRGFLFDTNKTFLLPTAVEALERIRDIYEANEPSDLLIVGHTDTTGEPSINDPLSKERAESVKAYLMDDVDAWLENYDASGKKRWGAREDRLMITAMPDFPLRGEDEDLVEWFQRTRELTVDGIAGPQTRRQLVTDYMALDGTSLADDDQFYISIATHGAGESFPLADTGFELDERAANEKEDRFDRRAELFFFDTEFGVKPTPGAANGEEYLEWRKAAAQNDDFPVEGIGKKATLVEMHDALFRTNSCVVLPEGEAPSGSEHRALTSVGLFATALQFSEEHGPRQLFIAGHADTTGTVDFNQTLSEERAKCVLALLEGDRDAFAALANGRHTVSDYKQIFSWCNAAFPDFDCDPGKIDDNEFTGIEGVKKFQAGYNGQKAELGAASQADLTVDGAMGPKTWGAVFDVYQFGIREELSEDEAGVAALRESLVFVDDARKALGFSEHHPIDKVGRDDARSQANRRVEVLFFEDGEEPDLVLAESDPEVSELFLPGEYVFEDVGPEPPELSSCDDCELLGPAQLEPGEENPDLPPSLKQEDRRKAVGLAQILLNDFIAQLRLGEVHRSGTEDAEGLESDLEATPTFIKVDCVFGDETESATKLFQRWHGGIEETGTLDERTWTRLIQTTELFQEFTNRPEPPFPEVAGEVDLTAVAGLAEPVPILLASTSDVIPSAGVRCARTYSRATNFAEFVTLVRDSEVLLQTCGEDTPDDVLGIIRGIFYGTTWSADFLVEKSPVRNTGFNVYATGSPLPPADPRGCLQCNLFEALRGSQDVVDGPRHVDFGHLIIGLEARFEGQTSNILLTGHSGLEAATWLGDLGGGAAMLANSRASAPSTRARTRFTGSNFGGSINLEGDVASYVVARSSVTTSPTAPSFSGSSTSPIADAIESYLAPGTSGGIEWLNRSRNFLTMVGGTLTGNTLTNRAAVVSTLQTKVEEFGCYYLVNRLRQTGRRRL